MRADLHCREDGSGRHFPSFSEGLSLREPGRDRALCCSDPFPFLFGGTFIEGNSLLLRPKRSLNFPSFSEGLSLRGSSKAKPRARRLAFPFLFGGTFIEGDGTATSRKKKSSNFPSSSEGLSLRV